MSSKLIRPRHWLARLKFYVDVNWVKTLYFNFRMFPFEVALKLPVYFYGSVKFASLKGSISISGPLSAGMVGFGQTYELLSRSKGTALLHLDGSLQFNGKAQFGKDYTIFVGPGAVCRLGDMAGMGNSGKLICHELIQFGQYVRIGYESQVLDSHFHQMVDTATNTKLPMTSPVFLGSYNYLGHRVTIMPGSATPDRCTVASNSMCNKDYRHLGTNILIGGIPAKLLKNNISRDWEGEEEAMEQWLRV